MSGTFPPISTWPVPPGTRSVALFGGTFDPVHIGHTRLALAARDALNAEWLVFMPAARNPLKTGSPTASDADRVEMLRLALEGESRVGISKLELDGVVAGRPSYTVETLRTLHARVGSGVSLRLVIGADQARSFHRWKEPREIFALAEPAVMLRSPDEKTEPLLGAMREYWSAAELDDWKRRILTTDLIDISATGIREQLASCKSHDDPMANQQLTKSLHPAVLRYISQHQLYGAQ